MSLLEKVRDGGAWLGAVRSWVQRKRFNGSRVTWGSGDLLEPQMTAGELEEACALAVEADRARILKHLDDREGILMGMLRARIEGME